MNIDAIVLDPLNITEEPGASMIIIVQRSDLSSMYHDLDADKVRLYHFGLSTETTQKAELIVFIDNSKVYVLRADKWPYSKSMSAAELIQYIANHVA